MRSCIAVAFVAAAASFATGALADPCTARLPPPGAAFAGPVRYVGDGDSLCIGASSDPATWIEVRLADFYAPELQSPRGAEAKRTLKSITAGRQLQCVAEHRSYDRIVASCRMGGAAVGDLLRRAGIQEGGRGR